MPNISLRHFLLRIEEAAYRYLELTETTMEILVAAMVGLGAGALGVGLRWSVSEIEEWRAELHGEMLAWIVFPFVSVAVLCVLYRWMRKGIAGYTFPDYLVNINLKGGAISKATIPGRFTATLLSIGGGASVGLEGPAAALGGAVGSATGRALRASADQTKTFVACGTAAGVASLFNAPLAGVFFALEIVLLGAFDLSGVILVVVASGIGVAVSRGFAGTDPSLVSFEQFAIESVTGLFSFAFLGLAIGLGAVLFIRGFHAVRGLAERIPVGWPGKLFIGAAGLAAVGFMEPGLIGTGAEVTTGVLSGTIERTAFALLCLSLLKALIAGWSLGCGFAGGMFGPCLYAGAAMGAAVGLAFQTFMPGLVPGADMAQYALVGTGAMLAAVNHAPLTGIFLLFEITDSYQVILPIMFASVIATWLARILNPHSLDTYMLAQRGIELHGGRESVHLRSISVGKILQTGVVTAHQETPLAELRKILSETTQIIVPVIDHESRLVGTVVGDDLASILTDPELGMVLITRDVMRVTVRPCRNNENLNQAMRRLNRSHLSVLPVVDRDGCFVGTIDREQISAAYDKSILLGVLESLTPYKEPE